MFVARKYVHTANVSAMKTRNHEPIEDCAKACTELITPERVRKVPTIESKKVAKDEDHVPDFHMPRFSCIITECRNAVPRQPGHERRVFHGVPSPIAAPSEHGVGPVRAEEDSDSEEAPGAAGNVDPFFARDTS